jgi:DNA-binding transcriptional ArsR family regulator
VSDVPPVPHPLPESVVELVAQRFRVLGEPMRIKVLDRLSQSEASVGELQAALGASQQNLSKHLGILHAAGMVSRTKDGNRTIYAISDPSLLDLCDHIYGTLRRQLADLDAILQQPAGDHERDEAYAVKAVTRERA